MTIKFFKILQEKTKAAEHRIPLFGVLASIGFLTFYFLNLFFQDKPDTEDLILRGVASSLSIPLVFFNRWPKWVEKFKPIHWNFTLFYTQGFFFTYMLFKNDFSTMSCLNGLIALTLIMLVTDLISASIIFLFGVLAAYGYAIVMGHVVAWPDTLGSVIAAYAGLAIYVRLFVFREEQVHAEKLFALQTFGSTVAHEMRRPLEMIRRMTSELSHLIQKYAGGNKPLEPVDGEYMGEFVDDLAILTDRASYSVDIILSNVAENLDQRPMSALSMSRCIADAVVSYPLVGDEEEHITILKGSDFTFRGNGDLVRQIFFNLIQNSLQFINETGKGVITIESKAGPGGHQVIFTDTSVGVRPSFLPKIFEPFESDRPHGTGIGLSFCRRAMDAMGGTITCDSVLGEYTTFVLTFPND